jgi:hypothetical protein
MRFFRKLCPLALVLFALPAAAGDLVGTWTGSFSCRVEDGNGRSPLRQQQSTLLISQPGGPGSSRLRLTSDSIQYSGSIAPSASDPTRRGVGAFVACGSGDTEVLGAFSEIELIRWSVDAGGRGSIRKGGVFVENGLLVGACTGGWRRTSTADPRIPACPQLTKGVRACLPIC